MATLNSEAVYHLYGTRSKLTMLFSEKDDAEEADNPTELWLEQLTMFRG